jgi:SAM-dependent methyltransferase
MMPYYTETELRKKWLAERMASSSLKGRAHYLLFLRLQKAYEFAGLRCTGKAVLDFGCGWRFGSALLAGYAKTVMAVDSRAERIDYCIRHWALQNVLFKKRGPAARSLPGDASFDAVVSFQVIEHVPEARTFLSDLKALLVPGGMLFLTTPNRAYRLLPFQRPWNPDHLREYYLADLKREISSVFNRYEIFGIYGNDQINAIEHNRVRDIQLRLFLHRQTRADSAPGADIIDRYDLGDFTIGSDMRKSLDFLAICRKD